jgi:hypothetical protein
MATARSLKAKTDHAPVYAAHDLAVAHFTKQAMPACEYTPRVQSRRSFHPGRRYEFN